MSADTYKVLRQTPTSKKEGSKLASLWRNVVNDLNVVNAIGSLVLRHEKDSKARKTTAFKEKTTLQNDIVSNDMTFKVLIYLIDKLIKPKNITLTLTLTHENGMETTHSVNIETTNERLKKEKENEYKRKSEKD